MSLNKVHIMLCYYSMQACVYLSMQWASGACGREVAPSHTSARHTALCLQEGETRQECYSPLVWPKTHTHAQHIQSVGNTVKHTFFRWRRYTPAETHTAHCKGRWITHTHTVAKGGRGHPTRTRTRVYRVPNMRSDHHTKEPGSMAWQPESIFICSDDHIVSHTHTEEHRTTQCGTQWFI